MSGTTTAPVIIEEPYGSVYEAIDEAFTDQIKKLFEVACSNSPTARNHDETIDRAVSGYRTAVRIRDAMKKAIGES